MGDVKGDISLKHANNFEGKFLTKQDEMIVLKKSKKLIVYTMDITSNKNKFPKRTRVVLCHRIQDTALDIFEYLSMANFIYVTNKKELRKRQNYKRDVILLCDKLSFYIQYSYHCGYINPSNFQHWGGMVYDIINMTRAWIKSEKIKYRNLV